MVQQTISTRPQPSLSTRTRRRDRNLARQKARTEAYQEAILTQKLSNLNFENVITSTEEGTELLFSLRKATKAAAGAEAGHIVRVRALEKLQKESSGDDDGDLDMADATAKGGAEKVQAAVHLEEMARWKAQQAREKVDDIRVELKKLVEGGKETDEALRGMLGDVDLD